MTTTKQFNHPLLPSDDEFERIKQSVLLAIELLPEPSAHQPHSRPRSRRPRSNRRTLAAAGATAAVLTVALVAVSLWAPRGAATAEAAEVLTRAAATATTTVDPVVGAKQFLRVREQTKSLGMYDTSATLDGQTRVLYVPGNKDASWYFTVSFHRPSQILGNRNDKSLTEYLKTFPFDEPRKYKGSDGKFGAKYIFPTDATYVNLSRNPDELLRQVRAMPGSESISSDERAFRAISDALKTGLVPADLRAAMYEAVAKIPSVFLSDGVANLDGRRGAAISFREGDGYAVEQLIIDRSNGEFIGVREVTCGKDGIIPAGTVVDSSAVTRTVINAVPAGKYVLPAKAG